MAFVVYGTLCVSSLSMVEDFRRFGLEHLRMLTGWLEILGGSGLLVGLRSLPALRISSGGLALLMLLAFAVRVRSRDGIAASLPSLLLMVVNVYILSESARV